APNGANFKLPEEDVGAAGSPLMFGGTGRIGKPEARLHRVALLAEGIMRWGSGDRLSTTALRIIDNEFNGAGSAPAVAKLPRQFTCWRYADSSAGLQGLHHPAQAR